MLRFLIKYRVIVLKSLALLSTIRIYNLVVLLFALYSGALLIFSTKEPNFWQTLWDWKLHALVLISVLCMAAGTIINNFYDLERDRFIKPIRTGLQAFVSKKFKLNLYLYINFFALLIAYFVSWQVLAYFFVYQFLLWFYSHKLNKIIILNNITYSLLSLSPFFALSLYYNNMQIYVIIFGILLFGLFMILDLIKDLISQNIDIMMGYRSVTTTFGVQKTKFLIVGIKLFCLLVVALFLSYSSKNNHYFLYLGLFWIFFLTSLLLLKFSRPFVYQILKQLYKLLIVLVILVVAFLRFIH